jgi:RNA polymerase sigma-70 factor (ECF subfamily)
MSGPPKDRAEPAEPAAPAALSAEAVRTLLEHRARFRAFLEARLGSSDLAEDVLQEAYAKWIARGGDLRDDESAVAWFYRLLRNAVVDARRRQGAHDRALSRFAAELDAHAHDDDVDRAVCACVRGVLDTLKPEYKSAVAAVDLDDKPVAELARACHISPNNAAVRLHRARQALGERLRATCGACARHGCIDCTCKH